MSAVVIIIAVIAAAYLFFHLGHGSANVRHGRARGLAPSVYWRAGMRGPWVSVRAARRIPRRASPVAPRIATSHAIASCRAAARSRWPTSLIVAAQAVPARVPEGPACSCSSSV